MAQFELNIYGKDDEIIAEHKTDFVRWGIFLEALKVQDGISTMEPAEQLAVISDFMKKLFPDLTDAEIEKADTDDVMNTFTQLIRKAGKIGAKSGALSKNAGGTV